MYNEKKYLDVILVGLFIFVNLIVIIFANKVLFEGYTSAIYIGVFLGLVVVNVFIFYLFEHIKKQEKSNFETSLIKLQINDLEQQVESIKDCREKELKIRHDYKNNISCIGTLLANEKVEDAISYIKQITDFYIIPENSAIICQNSMINAVLYSKKNLCTQRGIKCRYIITGRINNSDAVKISIVLFNLLDNAIEANTKIQGDKWILVDISIQDFYVSMLVKNPIQESVLDKNPKMRTTKNHKKYHGIGHLCIKEIVNECDGVIDYYEENDQFCVKVMLKLVTQSIG